MHNEPHKLAGKTVKILDSVPDFGGREYRVEDYWDRVSGKSWMFSTGNPACIQYAIRTGFLPDKVPLDNEVLYGKIGSFGHLFHVTEVEGEELKSNG